MLDEYDEQVYQPFLINRSLSYFPDTLFLANEMNIAHRLPVRLQYSFYLHSVRPKKRFAKWIKRGTEDDVQNVMDYYGLTHDKALEVLKCLTPAEVKELAAGAWREGVSK